MNEKIPTIKNTDKDKKTLHSDDELLKWFNSDDNNVDKNIRGDEQTEESVGGKEIEETNIKETPEYKKMKQLSSEIFSLSNNLPKDQRDRHRNKTYYIIKEEIVAENPEKLKKKVEDKIIELEEIKKKIEEELEKEEEEKKALENVEIEEAEIEETLEYKKMMQLDSETFFLNNNLPEDKRGKYSNKIVDIVEKKIIRGKIEDAKKEIKNRIVRLEEIKKEIEEEIKAEKKFAKENADSEIKALPDNFENNPIAIKSEKTELPVIVEQEKPAEQAEQIIDNDIQEEFESLSAEGKNKKIDEILEKSKHFLDILGNAELEFLGSEGRVKRESGLFGRIKIEFYENSENLIKKIGTAFGKEFKGINLSERAVLKEAAKLVKKRLVSLEQGPVKEILQLRKDLEEISKREKKNLSVLEKTSEKIFKRYKNVSLSEKNIIEEQIKEKQEFLRRALEDISRIDKKENLKEFIDNLNNLCKSITEEKKKVAGNIKDMNNALKIFKARTEDEREIKKEMRAEFKKGKKQLKELKVKEMELEFRLREFNKSKKELDVFFRRVEKIKLNLQ